MQRSEKFIANIVWNYPGITFSLVFISIILTGATTFHLIEGRRWFDSFYYAFSVMTTLGFGDFVPSSDWSKIITVIYGIIGIPTFLIGSGIVFQKIFFGHFKRYLAHIHHEIEIEKRLQQEIQKEIEEINIPRWKRIFKKKQQ